MATQKHIRFDWAIKRLLRDKANFGILEGFLSELLMTDIHIVEILESESNRLHETNKQNRVDILVKGQNDELMLIEVQNEREHDYFHRMNYGQAKLTSEHIDSGDTYDKIKRVFSINIVYFELGQGADYIYIGRTNFQGMHTHDSLGLSAKQKKLYANAKNVADIFATYYIIKVNNFDNIAHTTLDEWVYFLKTSEIKDDFKAKGLAEAKTKMRIDNLAGIEKEEYDNYIKEQRIREGEIHTAFFDGQFDARKQLEPLLEEERKQKAEAQKREEEERKQKEEERRQKEEERRQKEEERLQKEEAQKRIEKTIHRQYNRGASKEELAKDFGMSVKEIERILGEKKI